MTHCLSILAASIAACFAASQASADSARHYAADALTCGDSIWRIDLQFNPGGQPNLRVFWRDEARAQGGRDWQLPDEILAGAPVVLDRIAAYPRARLAGLGGEAPQLQMIGADNAPVPDCAGVALQPVAPPIDRYAAVLAGFEAADAVTPARVMAFRAARDDLPPEAMLPPLDRPEMQRRLRSVEEALAAGLADTVTAHATTPDDPDAAQMIRDLRGLWLSDPAGRAARDVLQLLRDAQSRRALAKLADAQDPANTAIGRITGASDGGDVHDDAGGGGDKRALDGDDAATCRVMAIAGRSMMAEDYVQIAPEALLEVAAQLPLLHWTRAVADDQLATARRCDAPGYADLLAREWPRIEARAAALVPLTDWAGRMAALPVTLADYDRANWLMDAPALPRAAGLSRQEAGEVTEALSGPLIARAVPVLAAELAGGLDSATEPRLIVDHCRNRMSRTAPARAELPAMIVAACEITAADRLRAVAPDRIAADRARTDAAPATLQGALDTNGFAIGADLMALNGGPGFDAVLAAIRDDIATVRAPMDQRLTEVLAAEAARLEAQVAALDLVENTPADLPDCRIYDQPQPWLQPLHRQCRDLRLGFALQHTEMRCEALFADAEAPDDMRSAQLDLGDGATAALRSLLCESGLNARLTQRGGLLSARRHEVTLEIGAPDVPLTLTGRLAAPEDGAELWQLTSMDVSPGHLAEGLDPDAPGTLRHCLSKPDLCAQ